MPYVPTSAPRTARRVIAASAIAAVAAAAAIPAHGAIVDSLITASADDAPLTLTPLGAHDTGVFDESAAEIVAFHAATARLFTVDANAGQVRVLDASDPTAPAELFALTTEGVASADGSTIPAGAVANSVAVREDGLVVVAVEAPTKTDDGWLAFFDAAGTGAALGAVRVGALPDNVAISPNGKRAASANEGEPNDDYDVDPEGSIAVVDLPKKLRAPGQDDVRLADFHAFEDALPEGVRVFAGIDGADFPVSRGLEPEYVTIDDKSRTAYVTLQENNAIAVVDLKRATVTDLLPLGAKDHSVEGFGLDPSDRDGVDEEPAIGIVTAPVKGLYMPDAIASFRQRGTTYLVTANEGDARDDWGDYAESARIKDAGDDGIAPLCDGVLTEDQLEDGALGRLDFSTASGFNEDLGCYDEIHTFGGRSFSIWTTDGELVFDSGDEFEQTIAEVIPEWFGSDNDESTFDTRSDAKGPEPEAVAIGTIGKRTYAFIGLERVGGIMVYDVTSPADSTFVTYVNNRDFAADPESPEAGDLGPEGLAFIDAKDSPTGAPMLAVASEVSGTTTLFAIDVEDNGKGSGKKKGRDRGGKQGGHPAPSSGSKPWQAGWSGGPGKHLAC